MGIERGLREWFESIEGDENRRHHLKAFGDFCIDLLEEEYGRIPQGRRSTLDLSKTSLFAPIEIPPFDKGRPRRD